MLPEMRKHGKWKFSEFFEFTKDKNTWTNILKQHEEATLNSIKNTYGRDELEIDASFISYDNAETNTTPLTGP
jgi:hypothetical protein